MRAWELLRAEMPKAREKKITEPYRHHSDEP